MGKGLRKRKNGSSYDGRAVMTGPLLKLPLINALQPIEEQRPRHCAEPLHLCVVISLQSFRVFLKQLSCFCVEIATEALKIRTFSVL